MLCGSEFRSPQSPGISEKSHVVKMGSGTLCAVLPKKSSNERFVVVVWLCLTQSSIQ